MEGPTRGMGGGQEQDMFNAASKGSHFPLQYQSRGAIKDQLERNLMQNKKGKLVEILKGSQDPSLVPLLYHLRALDSSNWGCLGWGWG